MWNTELIWRQWRGIGHHLALKVESCGFPQVEVSNSWFHSSNCGDSSEPLIVSQAETLIVSRCQRHFGILLELRQGNRDTFGVEAVIPASISCCNRDLAVCIDFPGVSGIVSC